MAASTSEGGADVAIKRSSKAREEEERRGAKWEGEREREGEERRR